MFILTKCREGDLRARGRLHSVACEASGQVSVRPTWERSWTSWGLTCGLGEARRIDTGVSYCCWLYSLKGPGNVTQSWFRKCAWTLTKEKHNKHYDEEKYQVINKNLILAKAMCRPAWPGSPVFLLVGCSGVGVVKNMFCQSKSRACADTRDKVWRVRRWNRRQQFKRSKQGCCSEVRKHSRADSSALTAAQNQENQLRPAPEWSPGLLNLHAGWTWGNVV